MVLGFRKIIRELRPFAIFLRYRQGLSTFDEVREYLARSVGDKHDIYMLPNTEELVRSEMERVISSALVGAAHNSVKKLNSVFNDLDLLTPWIGADLLNPDGSTKAIILAIYNNIKVLVDKGFEFVKSQTLSLDKAMDSLLLLDLDNISSSKRIKYVIMKNNISMARRVSKEMRFDPLQLEPRSRSMMLVKHMKDLEMKLGRSISLPK
jgi:hypothetical protein